jgi:hypothetical protein
MTVLGNQLLLWNGIFIATPDNGQTRYYSGRCID